MRWDSALIPIHESPECRDRGINECCASVRREGEVLSEMKSKEEDETEGKEKKEKEEREVTERKPQKYRVDFMCRGWKAVGEVEGSPGEVWTTIQ